MDTTSPELNPKHTGVKQLFRSQTLERLSRTHIAVPVGIFLLYASAVMSYSLLYTQLSAEITLLLFFIGMLVFTWFEYNMHRYVFHMRTSTSLRRKFQYTVHGVHHEYPKDKGRLAMPPVLSVTIATLFLILCRLVMGDFAFAFMAGFLVGYACYLVVHYMVHAYPPPKGVLRILWTSHAIHHYRDGELAFGVSSPLWDYIYGTMSGKPLKKVK